MKVDQERIYWHFKRNSWYVPILIAAIVTPFMIIGATTTNYALEIFVKLVSLFFLLAFVGYNLMIRTLRKRFDGADKP